MPELKNLAMHLIDQPELPMRASMDEDKMQSLVNSIAQIGQRLPIEVRERDGRYEIITGHRRYMACQRLGRNTIMALVVKPAEDAGIAAMIAENSEREDVNRAAEAIWLAQNAEKYNCSEDQLCSLVKKSPDYIADSFRLLRNDEQVFAAVLEDKINFSVARELNKCTDEAMRRNYLDQAIRSGTSARVVAEWVRNWRTATGGQPVVITPPAPAEGGDTAPAFVMCCELCGGNKDPYNLVSIFIHKWELEHIKRLLQQAAHAEVEP